ncbi:hypothetical protein [Sphingomonas jaspsi]|uniref:hypothetical protein n=1 Tax=Sphingomonas jaspsi TaxID=392409 RepID=UPI0004AE5F44|nr:hypothetical protein [Sphingomonas jaspsi]
MIRTSSIALLTLLSACAATSGPEPSLARRPAESIDPRVPVPGEIPAGTVDAALAAQLAAAIQAARGGVDEFDRRAGEAERLAAAAGPMASESWVAAQQSLSRLVEQQGVTARAAADVDALAATRLQTTKWLTPADQSAVRSAQETIAAIADPQLATIDRLRNQLTR